MGGVEWRRGASVSGSACAEEAEAEAELLGDGEAGRGEEDGEEGGGGVEVSAGGDVGGEFGRGRVEATKAASTATGGMRTGGGLGAVPATGGAAWASDDVAVLGGGWASADAGAAGAAGASGAWAAGAAGAAAGGPDRLLLRLLLLELLLERTRSSNEGRALRLGRIPRCIQPRCELLRKAVVQLLFSCCRRCVRGLGSVYRPSEVGRRRVVDLFGPSH